MFWFKRASVVLLSSCQTLCSESEQSSSCLCSHLYIYIYIFDIPYFWTSLSFSLMNITWNLPGERLTFTRRLAFEASSLKSCGREWTWTRVVVVGGEYKRWCWFEKKNQNCEDCEAQWAPRWYFPHRSQCPFCLLPIGELSDFDHRTGRLR